ncbi:TetR/AcrR family transcriptional regulator [Leifsonia virtsii]|uniref:TetR/AcrR family transcriptional regulator n=1 Tax=Leifsonia virtsii TaxID=3035915 RepID=A0ABT8J0M3_9MICO|nr:TetR/AcrR family transcriptional regulator [Leifsonia virtsii]MDN4598640.1 TetR/AcrR family transcriptional regulator [Leifsonia virtsii]
MPKVTEEHRQARRRQIAQAALRCFARSGFQQTSMADIIAESGLSAGAIYGHYKSKEELVELAVSIVLDDRFVEVADAGSRDPLPTPGEMVRLLLHGIESQIPDLGLLVQVWGQMPINPRLGEIAERVGARIRRLLTDYLVVWFERRGGFPPAEAAARAAQDATLYMGIVQGYVTQKTIFADFDPETYLAAVDRVGADLHR